MLLRRRVQHTGTANLMITRKPDNPLKRIQNPIPREPDNPIQRIWNLVQNVIWIQ